MIFNISVVNPNVLATLTSPAEVRGIGITQVVPDPVTAALPVVSEYQSLLKRYGKGAKPSYTSLKNFWRLKFW